MSQSADDQAAYGQDQNRESSTTRRGWQEAADRDPDDFDPYEFGPDGKDAHEVNPATGTEYGEINKHCSECLATPRADTPRAGWWLSGNSVGESIAAG
jgi:hypothetical protein